MEITASSVYDLQSIKNFQRTHQRITNRCWLIVAVLYLLLGTVTAIFIDKEESIYLFAVSALAVILFFIRYFFMYRIAFRRMKFSQNLKNEYHFNEDTLEMISGGNEYSGSGTLPYHALFRVIETNGFFYLYINRGQAFLVDKSTVSGGTENELRSLLTSGIDAKKYRYLPKRP